MLATKAARGKHRAQAEARAAGLETFTWACGIHGEHAESDSQHGWCLKCRQAAADSRRVKEARRAARVSEQRSNPEIVAHMRALAVNNGAMARMRKLGRPDTALPSRETLDDIAELVKLYPLQAVFDHIVPLKGKTVCGLHVWFNLQPTGKESNSIKSARFEPDRFPEQRPCNGFPGGQYHGEEGVDQLEQFLRMDIPLYALGAHLIAEEPAPKRGAAKGTRKSPGPSKTRKKSRGRARGPARRAARSRGATCNNATTPSRGRVGPCDN
jgi:hypothetical protein